MKVSAALVVHLCASLLFLEVATEEGTTVSAETTSETKSTLLTTAPVPWFPTESSQPPASDVEIVRSIELDYDINQGDNKTDSSKNGSLAGEGSNLSLKRLTEKHEFKPAPSIPFIFDDVLLQSEKQEPCKEIRTRSISEEEEPDNDFDFHSRLLLGKFLLRRSDSSETSSTRQSRVLNFEPIHTSKNDYPVETVTKKTYVSPRRYSARVRSKPTNSSRPINGRRPPLIEQSLSSSLKTEDISKGGVSSTTESNSAEQKTPKPKRNEEEVAAANKLEFGAKTSDRGIIKHKTRSQFTTFAPPQEVETHTVTNTAVPHVEYSKPPEEYEYREAQEEKRTSPYSSVTIQRGNIDQIPYVLAKDIQFVPVHVQKQPTQVIFIHPYASEYKQRPHSPEVPTSPVFDNHQWVPIQAEDTYVPVLVGPPQSQGQLHPVNHVPLNRLQHIRDPNALRHVHPQHFHNSGSLALRPQLQPHTSIAHTAPSTVYLNNHRSIDILPSGHALANYPPKEIPEYGK